MATELSPTKLEYFNGMWTLESNSTCISIHHAEDGRCALILDSTIFHPQGGGQPADTGFISSATSGPKFVVEDVRLKDGLVLHYGFFEICQEGSESTLKVGQEVILHVDARRRDFNSRLHSAGHLLDICMRNVGLANLEPGRGYHFPDGPFVEYKGVIPHDQLLTKQNELEVAANVLISNGGKVSASVLPYDEAAKWCGGGLPSYISKVEGQSILNMLNFSETLDTDCKDSTPRIVKLGENPGCPCGGTHVADIANIKSLKVTQIRTKKGLTKVFYSIGI